jgi:hypothetical protein
MGKVAVVVGAILALLASAFVPGALAWEFELAGSFNWTYEWYGQRGTRGFFGPYNVDNGGISRAANLNFWNGGQFDTNITTGSQAGWSYFNVEFFPKITVNPAIKLQGKYRLGTYGNPLASDYATADAPGTNNAFSEGQWTQFWATAQTPLGVLSVGKRPWTFGTGLQYDGEDAATTESLSLVVPYGPLDIGIAFYPYRFAGSSSIAAFTSYDYLLGIGVPLDPFDLPTYTTLLGFPAQGQYFSRADSSGMLNKDFLLFVNYYNGPLMMGVIGSFMSYHVGPEAVIQDPIDPLPFHVVGLNSDLTHGAAYLKFNNGRFFFNAEGAWVYWTDRWQADPSGVLGSQWLYNPNGLRGAPQTQYTEQWRYMVELGAVCGPTKVSLLNARIPGPDRRAGVLIDRQPGAFVWHRTFDRMHGNFDVFRPYAYLFSYDYGAGLGAYNLTGDGYLRDAFVLAGRLDYAVAANLNVYGTVFYANRTSNGYSWGCIGPNAGVPGFPPALVLGLPPTPDGNININLNRFAALPNVPNIPDTSLGYEVNLGLDWKLLEGMVGGILVGYWQPGKWFNYACIDRSVPGWTMGGGPNFGTRPDRTLDPIIGGNFFMKYEF